MYDYFKGILTDKKKTAKGTFVSIEVAGIGYLLEVTERDFICVNTSETEKNKIYVSLIHREDSMNLPRHRTTKTFTAVNKNILYQRS